MILNHVIDFVTDKDMQASADVRLPMIAFLKSLDAHLEKGYVPTKDVQIRADELDEAVQKYEEELVNGNGFDEVVEEVNNDDDDIDFGDSNDEDDEDEDEILEDEEINDDNDDST